MKLAILKFVIPRESAPSPPVSPVVLACMALFFTQKSWKIELRMNHEPRSVSIQFLSSAPRLSSSNEAAAAATGAEAEAEAEARGLWSSVEERKEESLAMR